MAVPFIQHLLGNELAVKFGAIRNSNSWAGAGGVGKATAL